MLDQQDRGRPGFHPGMSIRLADGQWWVFPTPLARGQAEPSDRPVSFGSDYDAVLTAIREAENKDERLLAELALAIDLLDRNYELEPDEFAQLFSYAASDPALTTLQHELHNLANVHLQPGLPRPEATPARRTWSWIFHGFRPRDGQLANPAA